MTHGNSIVYTHCVPLIVFQLVEVMKRTNGTIPPLSHEGRCIPFGRAYDRAPRVRIKQPRFKIAASQDYKCEICSHQLGVFDIDHRVPWACEGSEEITNLRALCPNCHAWTTRSDARWTALSRRACKLFRLEPRIKLLSAVLKEAREERAKEGDEGKREQRHDGGQSYHTPQTVNKKKAHHNHLLLCLDCKKVVSDFFVHRCSGFTDGVCRYPRLLNQIEALEQRRSRWTIEEAEDEDGEWSQVIRSVKWNEEVKEEVKEEEEEEESEARLTVVTEIERFRYEENV